MMRRMPAPALELAGIVKDYPAPRPLRDQLLRPFGGATTRVLHGIDLAIHGGEVVVLLGPNGSGKSTLLYVAAGLVLPTAGEARVLGADVSRDPAAAHTALGHASGDERGFYWRLDVRENLRFFATLRGITGSAFERRLAEVSDLVGISAQLSQPFRTLSAGQKARVALARAILHEPRVLLLDEVSRSLDPGAAERHRRLVLDLAGKLGAGVLYTTHSLEEARAIASRAALLVAGRIVAQGDWRQVEPAVRHEFFAEGAA
jgi:ABC-type multidrug transport system ATPase subunit